MNEYTGAQAQRLANATQRLRAAVGAYQQRILATAELVGASAPVVRAWTWVAHDLRRRVLEQPDHALLASLLEVVRTWDEDVRTTLAASVPVTALDAVVAAERAALRDAQAELEQIVRRTLAPLLPPVLRGLTPAEETLEIVLGIQHAATARQGLLEVRCPLHPDAPATRVATPFEPSSIVWCRPPGDAAHALRLDLTEDGLAATPMATGERLPRLDEETPHE